MKEEDKVGKDVIKEAITELGLPKITREDFSATLSNRTTKTVDFNLLLEKYPQAYAECVSEMKTPVLNITTNKEFFKEQVKRKIEQKNNNIRML